MSNPSTAQEVFDQWNGQVVPRSFNAGFVALSYVVSFIGAASTLELINRRTAPKGIFNHLLLFSAAVTMGGIAIWCMHYIGNRAIDLADGQIELQIAYSSGFTALSFFVPIAVLLAAFLAIGASSKVSWWRVAVGGALAGAAICGMHYLANASINNYICIYNLVNVVGAALIAVAASITALSLFFIFRAAWTSSWWKRAISAVVLAGAVSGMHWCASTGTQYKLVAVNEDSSSQLSRNTTVIVVICLSVGACFIMAGLVTYTARVMRRYANKAQQVVLAAAVFDKQGRVLVNPDGLLPSEKITDSFIEKTAQDSFSVSHPLFHWMFRASRNWSSITAVISGMANHLAHLPRTGRDGPRGGIRLINEHGDPIENYDIIFRELFCVAAVALAEKMKMHLNQVGILWDEILPTGSGGGGPGFQNRRGQREIDQGFVEGDMARRKTGHLESNTDCNAAAATSNEEDLAEKGEAQRHYRTEEFGRGSLMFLVRRVDSAREIVALEAAGYRFAELHQVSGIIGTTMQIKTRGVEAKLRNMATYAEENTILEPGVHLGFFGMRARVGTYGFDLLVQRGTRNLLPLVRMPLERLESWQAEFLRQFDRMTVASVAKKLDGLRNIPPREMLFASQIADSIESLRGWIDDRAFDDAVVTAKPVQVPCRAPAGEAGPSNMATVIALRLVVPIHLDISSPRCEFIPLTLFKVHQLVYKGSTHHLAFSRSVHREVSPITNAVPIEKPPRALVHNSAHRRRKSMRGSRVPNVLRRLGRPGTSRAYGPVDSDGRPIPTMLGRSSSPSGSNQSGSTLKLWVGGRSSAEMQSSPSADSAFEMASPYHPDGPDQIAAEKPARSSPPPASLHQQPSSFGGIMVSQEITVDVHETGDAGGAAGVDGGKAARLNNSSHKAAAFLGTKLSQGHNTSRSGETSSVSMFPPTLESNGPVPPAEVRAGAIEMRSLSDGSNVHVGRGVQVSNVEAETGETEASTFVDELFTVCVEGRF